MPTCSRLARLASLLLASIAAVPLEAATSPAEFIGLGDLPGAATASVVTSVSPDGSVAVGHSPSSRSDREGFRWDRAGGLTPLGDLLSGPFDSAAHAVSAAGGVVVGKGTTSRGYEAAVWSEDSLWSIGCVMAGDSCRGEARGVSGDGSIVVGDMDNYAFIYDNANGHRWLYDLSGGDDRSIARDVASGEGWTVVVGQGTSAWGREAFVWEDAGPSILGLGDLPGGGFQSDALAVSADGWTVVGWSDSQNGREACVWDLYSEPFPLGDLPGGGFYSEAYGVTENGRVVVGKGLTENGYEAFISTYVDGMRLLSAVLEEDHGLDLTGWLLTEARGISDDGRVIVGNGINPNGEPEAWRAVLPAPEPSGAALSVAASLAVLALRKKERVAVGWWRRKRAKPAGRIT